MTKFVFAYHGGPNAMSPDEGQAYMVGWNAWMAQLGDAVVDRGHAVGKSHTASADGIAEDGGSNPISGVTIIEAPDRQAAMAMAMASPHLSIGGTIEVAPVLDMPM